MQDDLRKLKKASGHDSDSDSDTDIRKRQKVSYLEEELSKYSKGRGRAAKSSNKRSRRDEEDDLLAELGAFSKRVMADEGGSADRSEPEAGAEGERGGGEGGEGGEEGLEVDDDVDWMKHRLKFHVDEKELTRRAEDEYSVRRVGREAILTCPENKLRDR
jgi:peptidyl-prolyl cis-trans isomerase SDCCAG10